MKVVALIAAVVIGGAGCAAPPAGTEVNDAVAALTAAANGGDPSAVRSRGEDLIDLLEERQSDIGVTRANALRTLTNRIIANAGDLTPQGAPPRATTTPTGGPSEAATSTPSPSPQRTREAPAVTQAPAPTTPVEEQSPVPAPTQRPARPEPDDEEEPTEMATPQLTTQPSAPALPQGRPSGARLGQDPTVGDRAATPVAGGTAARPATGGPIEPAVAVTPR